MQLSSNRLYVMLIFACLAGYVWLYLNLSIQLTESANKFGGCMIKHITNIPCPSCGSTRSVLSLYNGKYLQALYWNPFGFIIAFIMVVTPVWMAYDYFAKKTSLFNFYNKTEAVINQKKIIIPLIILVLMNWFWNIYKDL